MDAMELILLYDYYGDLLTQRQRECFEMRFHQDLSLGEIGEILSITRQGVHDNLSRAEQLLRTMEEKTGCVRRDVQTRQAMAQITAAAETLEKSTDETVADLARKILSAARGLGE